MANFYRSMLALLFFAYSGSAFGKLAEGAGSATCQEINKSFGLTGTLVEQKCQKLAAKSRGCADEYRNSGLSSSQIAKLCRENAAKSNDCADEYKGLLTSAQIAKICGKLSELSPPAPEKAAPRVQTATKQDSTSAR